MSWSIEFMPFVPWPVLWALAGAGRRAARAPVLARAPRRCSALLSYALLLLAIANPQLKQEDREPLNDVVAVVVDESQSQAIAGRTARTEQVRKDLEEKLKALPQSRRALGALDLDLDRQRARRHHAVHRSRQALADVAARPARGRGHDHRRRGA